jgi:chaperonin GroEL
LLRSVNSVSEKGQDFLRLASWLPVGAEPSVVVNKVMEGKTNFGYNAANDTYGDLIKINVIDPTKVARCALQSAASVAGLILTADAMVAELPREEKAPAMASGGGMDY